MENRPTPDDPLVLFLAGREGQLGEHYPAVLILAFFLCPLIPQIFIRCSLSSGTTGSGTGMVPAPMELTLPLEMAGGKRVNKIIRD